MTQKFSDILPNLDNADHVQRITLFRRDGTSVGSIENKPGSHGSIKVYHHLYQKWGSIHPQAAHEGLAIYAEHTEDAKLNPGKHPNIDRLLAVIAEDSVLSVALNE